MHNPFPSILSVSPILALDHVQASLSAPTSRTQVSEQALIRRIRRILAREGATFHVCRWDSRWFHDLARYYSADSHNHPCGPWLDTLDELEEYGREIHALAPHEHLAK